MKILYLAPHQMFPLSTGARLRDYHLAQRLASDNEVTAVEFYPRSEGPSRTEEGSGFSLRSFSRGKAYSLGRLAGGITGPTPLTVRNIYDSRAARQLAELVSGAAWDTIQMEGVHLSAYLPVLLGARNRPPIVVDWHNIESELMGRFAETAPAGPKKLMARRTATLLERAENRMLRDCAWHTVVSDREKSLLRQRNADARVDVIPNGVDVAAHRPDSALAHASERSSLLFVGSMDYHANIDAVLWFTRECWPAVERALPNLKMTIVGRQPPADVRGLAGPRIEVTGTVDDVRPYYRQAMISMVPLRVGGGTRLKILESMAAGVPVVSTALGAEGIDARSGQELYLANSPAEIVEAILALAQSPERRQTMAQAGLELVKAQYDWDEIGKRLADVHRKAFAARNNR